MSMCEALLSDFGDETKLTRKILEAVPEDRLDWKPHEKSMSLGQLAGHVAETPLWIQTMLEDEFDFAATSDWKPFVATDRAELFAKDEEAVAAFRQALDGRDDAFLSGTWTMRMGDKVLMQETRAKVIRDICIHHLAHHRGQLTVYLRLLDVPVPSTYGPTADDQSFG